MSRPSARRAAGGRGWTGWLFPSSSSSPLPLARLFPSSSSSPLPLAHPSPTPISSSVACRTCAEEKKEEEAAREASDDHGLSMGVSAGRKKGRGGGGGDQRQRRCIDELAEVGAVEGRCERACRLGANMDQVEAQRDDVGVPIWGRIWPASPGPEGGEGASDICNTQGRQRVWWEARSQLPVAVVANKHPDLDTILVVVLSMGSPMPSPLTHPPSYCSCIKGNHMGTTMFNGGMHAHVE